MRYFLRLAYNGSPFHGWQRQPNAIGVQQIIEDALSKIWQYQVGITGAGRTDTGVHAKMMYAHFDYDGVIDKKQLLRSLNLLVGKDIAIYDLLKVKDDAHARFDALSRSYEYRISLIKDPFDYGSSYFLNNAPDINLMNRAAAILLDISDFTSFAKLHSDAKTNICKVSEAYWRKDEETGKLVFRISANRFLRNMVRAVVGTLLEVGNNKLSVEDFVSIIDKRDRCEAGMSVPPQGLFLTDIIYPEEIFI